MKIIAFNQYMIKIIVPLRLGSLNKLYLKLRATLRQKKTNKRRYVGETVIISKGHERKYNLVLI